LEKGFQKRGNGAFRWLFKEGGGACAAGISRKKYKGAWLALKGNQALDRRGQRGGIHAGSAKSSAKVGGRGACAADRICPDPPRGFRRGGSAGPDPKGEESKREIGGGKSPRSGVKAVRMPMNQGAGGRQR